MKNHNASIISVPGTRIRFVEFMSCLTRQTARLLLLLTSMSAVALAQLPGDPAPGGVPPDSGSVLIYNYYASSIPYANEDTVLELTNNHLTDGAFVHLFFVAGANCSPADAFVCLAPNTSFSLRVSEWDPSTTGFLVAIALNANGLPINFNFLSGHEEIKLASGHRAEIDAFAIRAIASPPTTATTLSITGTLNFDGTHYSKVPRVLELEPVLSVADSNATILIVNNLNGNFTNSGSALGAVQGIFTNLKTQNESSFTDSAAGCQLNRILGDSFPAMTPVFSTALPKNLEGNLRIWATTDFGISGAAINFNSQKKGKKFNRGDNLRTVTVTNASLVIPIFEPYC